MVKWVISERRLLLIHGKPTREEDSVILFSEQGTVATEAECLSTLKTFLTDTYQGSCGSAQWEANLGRQFNDQIWQAAKRIWGLPHLKILVKTSAVPRVTWNENWREQEEESASTAKAKDHFGLLENQEARWQQQVAQGLQHISDLLDIFNRDSGYFDKAVFHANSLRHISDLLDIFNRSFGYMPAMNARPNGLTAQRITTLPTFNNLVTQASNLVTQVNNMMTHTIDLPRISDVLDIFNRDFGFTAARNARPNGLIAQRITIMATFEHLVNQAENLMTKVNDFKEAGSLN